MPGNIALFITDDWQFLIINSSFLILNQVFLYHQIVDDEVLAFHGVLSHVELRQFLHGVGLAKGDLLQTCVLTDEMAELVGRDFSPIL